ncbi:MAG: glycosyltransferase family 9 protein [PVC group bacterium]|nr:glycosyltransferase family 9 protein [PVC group bacterium]
MKLGKKVKKILVFGHSNIGDVCYDLIGIKPLREAFPHAHISFVTSLKAQEVVKTVFAIDEVIIFDKQGKDRGMLRYLRFIGEIRKNCFDLSIILRRMQMYYFFGIPVQIKAQEVEQRHVALRNLQILEVLGIKPATPEFGTSTKLSSASIMSKDSRMIGFSFSDEENKFTQERLGEKNQDELFVGIMPFSAWKLKCWPVEKWNELIEFLTGELKAKVFVFGKTGDTAWETDFVKRISKDAVSVINKCTLRQSLAIINKLDLFVGVDTSLLHFASCMQVPAIGLYGPTDHKVFYPFFHEDYAIVSKDQLKCAPCYRQSEVGPCGVKDNPAQCMIDIDINQIVEKIKTVYS